MPAAVIGRDDELGSIQAFLEQVRSGPAVLVLSGEPGIGKTILWQAGVEQASGTHRVLSYRASETEARLSFAALSDCSSTSSRRRCPRSRPRAGARSRSRFSL